MQFIKTDYAPGIDTPLQEDGGLNEKSGGLNEGLKFLLMVIKENPGIQIKELAEKLNRSIDTLDKQIKKLTEINLVERRGSKKTGGYWMVKPEGKSNEK